MELNLDRPIAFFDLETTGINVGKDRIVEIAVIKINKDGSTQTLEQRINPEMAIPDVVSKIHGIYDADVKFEPTFKEFAGELATFIGKADLAGYNSNKFDVPLLVEEFIRAEVDFDMKDRRMIDAMTIFMKMEQRNLAAAYKFYCGKELVNAHAAIADVTATLDIFKAQLDHYKGKEFKDRDGNISVPVVNDMGKIAEFSRYHKNADLVGQIIFNEDGEEIFNFGKNKGKSVAEVFDREPQYYDWMMRADFPGYTKKVITEIKLRGFGSF